MTRLSDMAHKATLPASAGRVPVIVDGDPTNYVYDLASDLTARPKTTDLAAYAKSADLSDSTNAVKGAALSAFNSSLSYTAGSVGAFLKSLLASTGSSLIGFIGTAAGAVGRTTQDKLNDAVHAKDFGLVGDGSDETTKLTNFFNSAIANPGVPHRLEQRTYGVSSLLPTINVDGVTIEDTAGSNHEVGSLLSGPVLKWLGGSNAGPLLTIAPVAGASNQFLTGIALRLGIDCNSLLGNAVLIQSIRESTILLAGANATSILFDFGVISGSLGENSSMQRNTIRLYGRQVEAPNGICLQHDGNASANVSMNEIWCDFHHTAAPAIVLNNSDNNDWRFLRTFCSAGATESVRLLGGATTSQLARDEHFWFVSSNLPLRAYGTEAPPGGGTPYVYPSYGSRVFYADWDNGTPSPVIGPGAWLDCELPVAFTPTITGVAGTGLATSSVSGTYIRENAFVDVALTFVVSAGTGYSAFNATLPFAAAGTIGRDGIAKETTGGKTFSTFVAAGGSSLSIQSVDGSTALPTGTYTATIRYRVR